MTLAHVKVCRDCGEEYRPQATRCADCGGELVDRQLDEDGLLEGANSPEPGAEVGDPGEATGRVLFATPRASELVPLAEELREQGLPYRLLERPPHREGAPATYALVVPEEEADAAQRALAPLVAPEHDPAATAAVEAHFEPGSGYRQCPACGAEQPSGAGECAECGLTLGAGDAEEEAVTCARCGAPLADADRPCAACGSTRVG
jgi:ribosomal protein L40E